MTRPIQQESANYDNYFGRNYVFLFDIWNIDWYFIQN